MIGRISKYLAVALLAAGLLSWPLVQAGRCEDTDDNSPDQLEKRANLEAYIDELTGGNSMLEEYKATMQKLDDAEFSIVQIEQRITAAITEINELSESFLSYYPAIPESWDLDLQSFNLSLVPAPPAWPTLVLESTSTGQLIERVNEISRIIEFNNVVLRQIQDQRLELDRLYAKLARQQQLLADYQAERARLDATREQEKQEYLEQIALLEQENERIKQEISEISRHDDK